jgi:hypothetical protein
MSQNHRRAALAIDPTKKIDIVRGALTAIRPDQKGSRVGFLSAAVAAIPNAHITHRQSNLTQCSISKNLWRTVGLFSWRSDVTRCERIVFRGVSHLLRSPEDWTSKYYGTRQVASISPDHVSARGWPEIEIASDPDMAMTASCARRQQFQAAILFDV